MKKLTVLMSLMLVGLLAIGQSFDKQKIDSLMNRIEEFDKCMGSISIFQNGKEIYQRALGYADVENNTKSDVNTKYRIGSVSKMFTATIILKLIEEGKLTLDTKLDKFYPEIPNAGEITVEHLLRHRSGLFNFTNAKEYLEYMDKPQTHEFLIHQFIKNGTEFEPGEKMQYSNTNYILLSYIIEKIEKKDYADVLKDKILVPCNLKNTNYGGKIDTRKNEALSYKKVASGWELEKETDMSIPTGAGGIVSTPTDLNQFLYCLFTGEIISESSLNKMKEMVDGYGLGLTKITFYDRYSYGHGGAIDAFRSSIGYFPEENVAVSGILNGGTFSLNNLMIGVLSIYFGQDYQLPEFTPAIELSREELEQYPGIYSASSLPIKLTISLKENQLYGQGTGQPSFPLEAFDKNKFRFETAGLEIEFFPSENKLNLKQGGSTFELKRE